MVEVKDDLTGKVFGLLTVLEQYESIAKEFCDVAKNAEELSHN